MSIEKVVVALVIASAKGLTKGFSGRESSRANDNTTTPFVPSVLVPLN